MKIVSLNDRLIDGVLRLERLCFSAPWTRENIESTLKSNCGIFLAAIDGDSDGDQAQKNDPCSIRVAGYISATAPCETAYINNVAVDPDLRRKGIGKALLCELERAAKKKGCLEATLEVRKSNAPAAALYEKCGYKSVGLRKDFYRNPCEDALIMTKIF